ncbi:MAG: alpha/beta hydrolase [Corynebacterium sp.]|uniref:alpha/beta hydrolase n=1 Tax=Corynebacterium sp. TaxID=1720 RepID=UPI0026E0D554|nr:alpha/beta hydrolase [Corynebacterium sp.]MDO5670062.1 alpha/beta hydrolase [Corynebacterium sp.]
MLLDVTSLRRLSHQLTNHAAWLSEQHSWLARSFDALEGTGFSGPAATAAVGRLHRLATPLSRPPEQMLRVAHVLSVTAALQEELDAAASRAALLARQHPAAAGALALLMRDLRGLGDVLDATCARSIDLLCTEIPVDTPRRWSADPDLGLAALDQRNRLESGLDLPPDVQLLEVDGHRLVAAVGDLEHAESVTTLVLGTGSSAAERLPVHLDRARTISAATGGAAVVWLGYPAPPGVAHALAQEPARAAGGELQAFQKELTRRFPRQRRIVLGYSYGGMVAAQAAARGEGMYADRLVFVGSPGVGVDKAAQLTLLGDDPQIHAMTNPSDPVKLVGGVHGPDPAAPGFGARVLSGDPEGTHSSYWEDPLLLGVLQGWAQKKPSALSE